MTATPSKSKAAKGQAVIRPVRAIGYVRVSTGEQSESGLGLKAQVAAIRSARELRGWELVAVREEVKSGARADNRPVLADVMRALRGGGSGRGSEARPAQPQRR